jgi:2-hydroxy-3-oxopropionate reductase
MKIGFIGLGIMGSPMAGQLIKGGHEVYLYSRSQIPGELVSNGGIPCQNASEVATRAEVIILMLPDTPDVEKVLFGEEGISDALSEDQTVIDMSSISPIATREFATQLAIKKVSYVDAPVSGGEIGAKNATLTIMVGANESVFSNVEPIFKLMGRNITHVGDVGAGQVCKVANQVIVALNIEAVGEALLLASKAGVDPSKVRQALMGGFASSKILEIHGERMIERTFKPGFRIELHQKDLNLALSTARSLGLSLPNTSTAQELFNACSAAGDSSQDHSAMVCALERLAQHKVA